jgi:hypothetical protein
MFTGLQCRYSLISGLAIGGRGTFGFSTQITAAQRRKRSLVVCMGVVVVFLHGGTLGVGEKAQSIVLVAHG